MTTTRRYIMSTTTVETQPNLLSATAVIGASIVNHAVENLGRIDDLIEASSLYTQRNKDFCRLFVQKVFNEGELPLIWDFMSPDVVNHELTDSFGDSQPSQRRGIEWMADLVHLYRHAFPDLHLEIQDQIAEDDRVVTCLRMRGTQKNALLGISASGRKVDIDGIRVDRMAGGKIVESWFHFDALGMLRQLHALPALHRRPRKVAPASYGTATGSSWPSTAQVVQPF
jgi:predicted ester cyclase